MAALGTLVKDGLSAATFFASGTHQSYGDPGSQFKIGGRTPVEFLTEWFDQRMQAVGV